jgi:GntR family transcriptional regulator
VKGGATVVNINYRDPRPIYEQVKDELRMQIITNVIRSGDKMPSVRELASQLVINPNTIQRAYRELEGEGYIYSVPGKGSFAGDHRDADSERIGSLFRQLEEVVSELGLLGVSKEALCNRIMEGGKQ